jgi:hypothetical protein
MKPSFIVLFLPGAQEDAARDGSERHDARKSVRAMAGATSVGSPRAVIARRTPCYLVNLGGKAGFLASGLTQGKQNAKSRSPPGAETQASTFSLFRTRRRIASRLANGVMALIGMRQIMCRHNRHWRRVGACLVSGTRRARVLLLCRSGPRREPQLLLSRRGPLRVLADQPVEPGVDQLVHVAMSGQIPTSPSTCRASMSAVGTLPSSFRRRCSSAAAFSRQSFFDARCRRSAGPASARISPLMRSTAACSDCSASTIRPSNSLSVITPVTY